MEHATDYTLWALFARATITVKLVMIGMVAASIWTWAVIIDKMIQFRRARAEAAVFDQAFWSGEPLDELYDQIGPDPKGQSEKIFAAGMLEWRRAPRDGGLIAGAQARIDRSMDVAIAKEAEKLQKGLPVLATVGSTAPFVGLFGTVWGIMNSFIEIAEEQNTNLAVGGPRHRRGAAGHGPRPSGRDPGGDLLQQAVGRREPHPGRLRGLRRRIRDDPVAPAGQLRPWPRVSSSGDSGGGSRRRRGRGRAQPMSEINITPFVDVMLVLLIIFMVAAPLLTVGVPVELPRTAASALPTGRRGTPDRDRDGRGHDHDPDHRSARGRPDPAPAGGRGRTHVGPLFLRADGANAWNRVAEVMGALNAGGFSNIGLVTDVGGPGMGAAIAGPGGAATETGTEGHGHGRRSPAGRIGGRPDVRDILDQMTPGTWVSAAGHSGLVVWVIFGWGMTPTRSRSR
jgi:biopolymer transport protein TolQ